MGNSLVLTFIKNITSNNIALYALLGICPLILYQLSIKDCLIIGIAITAIMLLSTWSIMLFYYFIIIPINLFYLKFISFTVIIYLMIEFAKITINKFYPSISKLFDRYPEFFHTNIAIYGSIFLNIKPQLKFLNITVNALSSGLGYLILMLFFYTIKTRINDCKNSSLFHQLVITLILLGLMSLVFVGTTGFGQ
ncbi:MAG: Rnf-Nqr domain containing protein [bacterium]